MKINQNVKGAEARNLRNKIIGHFTGRQSGEWYEVIKNESIMWIRLENGKGLTYNS